MNFKQVTTLSLCVLLLAACKSTTPESPAAPASSVSPVIKAWSQFDYDQEQDTYVHHATGFKLPVKIGSWQRMRAPRQVAENDFAQTPYSLPHATATVIVLKAVPENLMKKVLMVKLASQVEAMRAMNPDLKYHYLGSYQDSKEQKTYYGPTAAYVHADDANKMEMATTLVSKQGFFAVRVTYDDISKPEAERQIDQLIRYLAADTAKLTTYN